MSRGGRGGSSRPWSDDVDDDAILRSLPRGPGQRAALPTDSAFGSLRFSDDFLAAASRAPKNAKAKPPRNPGFGQDMSQVYRCAACHVDSSGVLSFAQHCGGKAHRSAAGFAGFAGLEANAAGITPPVDDALLRACGGGAAAGGGGKAATRGAKDKAGADKGKPPKGEPGVVAVSLTDENHANIRSALQARCAPSTPSRPLTPPQRSASETGLAASVPQAAAGPPPWRAKSRGGGEGGGGGEAGPSYVAAAPAASSLHKSASTPVLSSGAVLPAPRGVDGAPRAAEGAGGAGPRVEVYRRGGGDGPAPATRPPLGPRGGGGGVPAPPPALATSRADVAEMLRVRAQLPAAAFAAQICAAVASHPVVIVQGETGCGKSTQVPQFLLQEAAERCTSCNIICTQPRRISAIGVAERVAAERCERIGGAVGYTIRLESATSAATRLLFCTTGILLRRLEEDPTLADVSHVLVDEVHERSMESDFLLMVLRGLLPRRPDLRIVLMSATIEAGLFATYFGAGTPTIIIPGRTFPDALEVTGHRVRAGADWARKKPGGGGGDRGGGSGGGFGGRDSGLCHDFTLGRCERGDRCRFAHEAPRPVAPTVALPRAGAPPARGAAGGGACGLASRVLGGEPGSAAASDDPDEALGEGELGERYPLYKPVVVKALAALDHAAVDLDLLAELVAWIMAHGTVAAVQQAVGAGGGAADDAWGGGGGAGAGDARGGARAHPAPRAPEPAADSILVFLPGVKEITAAFEALTQGGPLAHEPQRSWVLPLHSLLSSDEQRRIFMRPPDGVRKVVLATNIAETSITIDDCGFVIDCGRMKETRYDPARRMESLEDVAVSRANAKQRRGRAGRVKSGVCFHLVTRHAFERRLDAAQAPEMHRVPLEQLVLRIKVLRYPGTAAQVVARCLQPPAPEAVSRAVTELVRLDALTLTERGDEALTPLGTHLAALPVDVRIGKLILLGAIFGLTDDVLTIAAVLSGRPPFLSPFERRAEADASKRAFCVAQSDHLTALNAYREFDRGGAGRFDMCRERFLGVKTLITIAGVKRQLLELLSDARFVRPGLRARGVEALGRRVDGSDGVRLALEEGLAGGDACFRCGGRGHAARDCAEPARSQPRALQSADDAWRRDTLDAPLIKALLTAALYPQVMTVTAPPRAKGGGGKPPSAGQLKFHIREDSGDVVEVAIHPSSVNAREGAFDSPYLVFLEKVRTTRVYVRDCSTVSPYALLLFGGALHADRKGAADQVVTVDGWIRFSLPRKAVELIISVRNEMNAVLKRKIERPAEDVSAAGRHILDAVAQLISTQG